MIYPVVFRKKVLEVKAKEKLSLKETAKRFAIGVASVSRWIKDISYKAKRNKPATKINMKALKEDLEIYPDGYLVERAARLGASKSGIHSAIKRLGISRKKKLFHIQKQTKKKERISKKQ